MSHPLTLISPKILPPLDKGFRPAVLANQNFQAQVKPVGVPLVIGLERSAGEFSRFETTVYPEDHPERKQISNMSSGWSNSRSGSAADLRFTLADRGASANIFASAIPPMARKNLTITSWVDRSTSGRLKLFPVKRMKCPLRARRKAARPQLEWFPHRL